MLWSVKGYWPRKAPFLLQQDKETDCLWGLDPAGRGGGAGAPQRSRGREGKGKQSLDLILEKGPRTDVNELLHTGP